MNIFFLHPNPRRCARWHCDKHVVKMLLESCQLLYTAHWVLVGSVGDAPKNKSGQQGYLPTHRNHPCGKWVRESLANYRWLCRLASELVREYKFRYNGKTHACEAHVAWLQSHVPAGLEDVGQTRPAAAMSDEYKQGKNIVASYRKFYVFSKGERGFLHYTGRSPPHWIPCSLVTK
jgi:hypothetical protein